MASTILIVIFAVFILFAYASSSTTIEAESAVRESFPMDGDVAWVVQVSDLHLSAYHPERAADLVHLLSPAITVIRPSLLLFTGDITDAKNKRRTSTRQDVSEWIQYRNSVQTIVNCSGLEKRRIFDTRGNHDKYGVPNVGHELDFFSIHSVSSQLGRLNTIQSISLVGNDRNYFFIGIDDTLSIGIRGPSNLFGHPTEERITAVESELQYLDTYPGTATKVIFGHFPLSFTASSRKGRRYENVFARQSVSSYICGHLHGKFSRQLWRLHSEFDVEKRVMSFWEWELGDWKDSRLIRILAIDRGVVSFLDVELRKYQAHEDFDTTILITYPVDSRNMNNIKQNKIPVRNDINALVFSSQQIINVTARVFDSFREYKIVEEVPLQHIHSATDKPLFHGKWNAESYRSASATRYLLQITAFDSQGKVTRSNFRPFSVEGKLAPYTSSWLVYLVFNVEWENLYLILLWSNMSFLAALLCLPKILNFCLEKNESCQTISSRVQQRKSLFFVHWFLVEGSRNRMLWLSMIIYLLCLLKLPWLWGYATSENEDITCMYLSGWSVQSPDQATIDKQGNPDLMVITLPFMYLVVTPMFILIYSLFAESSAVRLQHCGKSWCRNSPAVPHIASEQVTQLAAVAPSKSRKGLNTSLAGKICNRWTRMFLLLGCLVTIVIHFKLCLVLMFAYGAGPIALSPALSWAPPLFIVVAVYSTRTNIDSKEDDKWQPKRQHVHAKSCLLLLII